MVIGANELRPICYVVMPFRRKKVEEPRPTSAPVEIDFDALWERAYWPAIEKLGYLPMRADCDPSSAIVKAMLERIAFADLVLSDVTLGNGNVYYEVGIRHVAKETHCVMVAPDWSKPLFDISQFASIRFPLVNGDVPEVEARAIYETIVAKVPAVKGSRTPYYELLRGSLADSARQGAFRDFAERLSTFQAKVKTIRLETSSEERKRRLSALQEDLGQNALEIPEVVVELVVLLRDAMGWQALREFIERLSAPARRLAFVEEQYLLALAETGDPKAAIAGLEQLIQDQGDTPERRGLIGGRYKRLWRKARKEREALQGSGPSLEESNALERAIENYTRGMELDYNQYFCSCNLPQLLRARGEDGDAERAVVIDHFVVAACDRALARGEGDEYLRPTLLGAAFRAGDVKRALELVKSVRREGPTQWKLASLLDDLAESVRQTSDTDKRSQLKQILDGLAQMVR